MLPTDDPHSEGILRQLGRAVQFRPFSGPRYEDLDFLFVAMVPRSGSSYLGSLISANGFLMQGETFRFIQGTFERYVRKTKSKTYEEYIRNKISDNTKNGMFSAKVGWPQFNPIYFSGAYRHYFSSAKFVYLTREDILDQSISLFIAQSTGYFHSTSQQRKDQNAEEIHFDFDAIAARVVQFSEMQSNWERFFASEGIRPLRVTYEQLLSDPEDVVRRIGNYINRPMTGNIVTETAFKKISTNKNSQLRDLYIAEHKKRLAAAISIAPPPRKRKRPAPQKLEQAVKA
ncbi:Stf0 family sulfotransferase [Xanthobacter agilis]|uniref:LPS sulfotransferase NodH n=1 Tax=Xanthobacter agilis TaxID=47492 RepID=A0ABU0L812_XANAG|nr:Stf0 family sulfotransferase [Xanthobacter agilis]MDQ0503245.1 LPS sulfotransferase NodH [Xanthobacter agilis]